ncbi:DUF7834 domain-containing protein, partial [Enterobacter hormaechei]
DQMIINGRRFFEMTSHYQQKIAEIVSDERSGKDKAKVSEEKQSIRILGHELEPLACKILHTINTYRSRTRTGDGYVRTLFD